MGLPSGLGWHLRTRLGHALLPWRLGRCGRGVVVDRGVRVFHPERVFLDHDVQIGAETYLIGNTLSPIGVQLGTRVRVGAGCYLAATDGWIVVEAGASLGRDVIAYGNGGLTIGAGARLEDGVAISTVNHCAVRTDVPIRTQGLELAPVTVGPGAWIGQGAILLPGVQIGRRARVAPGSVVTRSVPEGAQVSGAPARVAA